MKTPKLNDHAIAILDAVCCAEAPPPASNFLRAPAYMLAEFGLINIIGGKAHPTVEGLAAHAALGRAALAA